MNRDLNRRTYRNLVVQRLNRANGGVWMPHYGKNAGIAGPDSFPENMINSIPLSLGNRKISAALMLARSEGRSPEKKCSLK